MTSTEKKERIVQQAKLMLDMAGINYSNDFKIRLDPFSLKSKCLGICSYTTKTIKIKKFVFDLPDESIALNIVVHELIHTVKGCDNHNKKGFLRQAEKFNNLWEGFNGLKPIGRWVPKEYVNVIEAFLGAVPSEGREIKYLMTCPKCGAKRTYTRKPKYDISNYICTCCGNEKLELEKL